MKLTFAFTFSILFAATSLCGQVVRIGTFDRQSVVVAWYNSSQWNGMIKAKKAERDRASRSGDAKKAKELEGWGQDSQELAHKQLTGEAGIANITEALKPVLAEIARIQGLSVITADAAWAEQKVQTVDVTDAIVDGLKLDERKREMVRSLREKRRTP